MVGENRWHSQGGRRLGLGTSLSGYLHGQVELQGQWMPIKVVTGRPDLTVDVAV